MLFYQLALTIIFIYFCVWTESTEFLRYCWEEETAFYAADVQIQTEVSVNKNMNPNEVSVLVSI